MQVKYILQDEMMKIIITNEDNDIKRKEKDEELVQDKKKEKEEEYKEPPKFIHTNYHSFEKNKIKNLYFVTYLEG